MGYGLEYKDEFKAYPVKDGPRTVVIRRRLQTPLTVQCFPRLCRDALTVDFYTLGGRDLGRPATFRCEDVGFHKLEQKARKRALRAELLKSPLQAILLVVQGSTLAPTSNIPIWSREIRMEASARRLRTNRHGPAKPAESLVRELWPCGTTSFRRSKARKRCARLPSRQGDESIKQGSRLGTEPGLETPVLLPIGRFSYATSLLCVRVHSF